MPYIVMMTLLLSGMAKAPPYCTTEEFRQFDFWVGDWNVTVNGKVAGTNKIDSILGGCALQENWVGQGAVRGHSFNSYDASSKRWHQTWVDNSGALLQLDGGILNGAMVLVDSKSENRITWSKQPEGKVRQLWETSTDGGKTWAVAFDGLYSKKIDSKKPDTKK